MWKRFLNGLATGSGLVVVVAIAVAIAYAGDVFTVDKDGTLKFAVSDQGKITVGATESYVNLVIQNNAATANNTVDVIADTLTVEGIRLETVNVSADLTLSGAGGLDTGSEAANTWYPEPVRSTVQGREGCPPTRTLLHGYVWVVTNNNGTSSNGLLSTSSTAPTMPSGFTKKRRVGAVRNDGSSNFFQFVQEGNRVLYQDGGGFPLWGGTATSWTAVSCASYIPPTSRRGEFRLATLALHSVVNTVFNTYVRPTGSGAAGGLTFNLRNHDTLYLSTADVYGECNLDNSQQIDYYIATAPNVSGGVYIAVRGYYDRI